MKTEENAQPTPPKQRLRRPERPMLNAQPRIKEHPIIFSAPMVRAILEGRKTQTRRIVTGRNIEHFNFLGGPAEGLGADEESDLGFGFYRNLPRKGDNADGYLYTGYLCWCGEYPEEGAVEVSCPYGEPGDRLWMRETHVLIAGAKDAVVPESRVAYRADREGRSAFDSQWIPSIFMQRRHSRITLEVTKVRVERLQQISGADAAAEGATYPVDPSKKHPGKCSVLWNISSEFSPLNYIAEKDRGDHEAIMRAHFAAQWDTLNFKRGGWAKNPWVWVIEFQRLTTNGHE